MTTGKAKTVAFLILLLTICIASVSCTDSSLADDAFDKLLNSGDTTEKDIPIADIIAVIIPDGSSADIFNAASSISKEVLRITEIKSEVFYDSESLPKDKKIREIIIGNSSREASRELISGLKRDDYICALSGENIILGGKNDGATLRAIEKFEKEVLPYVTRQVLMSEGAAFSYFGEYDMDKVFLGGFELSRYALVLCENKGSTAIDSEELKNTAEALLLRISELTGYVPDILTERESTNLPGIKRILLSTDLEKYEKDGHNEFYIINNDSDIVLLGKDANNILAAGEVLLEKISESLGKDKNSYVDIEKELIFFESENRFAVKTLFSASENRTDFSLDQVEKLSEYLKSHAPDVYVHRSFSKNTEKYVTPLLPTNYSKVSCYYAEEDFYLDIYYNKDVFKYLNTENVEDQDLLVFNFIHLEKDAKYFIAFSMADSSECINSSMEMCESLGGAYSLFFFFKELSTPSFSGSPVFNEDLSFLTSVYKVLSFSSYDSYVIKDLNYHTSFGGDSKGYKTHMLFAEYSYADNKD